MDWVQMTGKSKEVIEPHCHFNCPVKIIQSFGFGHTALEEVVLNKFCMCLATAVAAFTLYGTASAMTPGQHPGYLHALTELKTARWMINHRATNAPASVAADGAVMDINAAIGDIKHAATIDDKNLDIHPPADAPPTQKDRLQKALKLLGEALGDVKRPEDNPAAGPYRRGAIRHINAAISQTKDAIDGINYGR